MTDKNVYKVRTPLFPLYSWVRAVMNVIDGVPKTEVTQLIRVVLSQTGTPQNPVDDQTYSNACEAAVSGVNVAYTGNASFFRRNIFYGKSP